jgi:hypothetical protein
MRYNSQGEPRIRYTEGRKGHVREASSLCPPWRLGRLELVRIEIGNTEDRKDHKGILSDWTAARQTPISVSFAAFCVLFFLEIRAPGTGKDRDRQHRRSQRSQRDFVRLDSGPPKSNLRDLCVLLCLFSSRLGRRSNSLFASFCESRSPQIRPQNRLLIGVRE